MMPRIAELLTNLDGARPVGTVKGPVLRVHTDTRTLRAGDLYVALRGERFDGHDFLAQAREAGAVAALAERGLAEAGLPGVEVPDSRHALGELARRWRAGFDLPLIAVTGSNGKTTVTQMIAAILRAAAGEGAHATEGNLNNDIGVPLTLLRLREGHRYSVVELGMNHPGEIARLAAMAQPTVALVNNAQREHQEFMATVEAVARENGSVFGALPAHGTAVFPSDDAAHTPIWRALAGTRRVRTFSDADPGADVCLLTARWLDGAWQIRWRGPAGEQAAALRVAGRHNLRNAMAAVACALAAGVPPAAVARGLAAFEPVRGRSRSLALRLGGRMLTVVDDTYNANPDSMIAAIEVLAELPAPRLLVVGDMGEVGDQGLAFHQEVLRHAHARGIDRVLCTGSWMARASATLGGEAAAEHWDDVPALAAHVVALARQDGAPASMLVKGSRFMRMERVVEALVAAAQESQGGGAHAA
jgi:UDP-N-acetylmuramoyl-tripeptide--D-alanyl-D-alanine ligase